MIEEAWRLNPSLAPTLFDTNTRNDPFLALGLAGSSTEISELSGLSSGRVRQIIRMGNMRPEIISHLKGQSGKKALRKYSQKRIQAISAAKLEDQVTLFEKAFSVKIGS